MEQSPKESSSGPHGDQILAQYISCFRIYLVDIPCQIFLNNNFFGFQTKFISFECKGGPVMRLLQ